MAAHPLVFSFPESHFFPKVFSTSKIKRIFGLSSKDAKKSAIAFLNVMSKQHLLNRVPGKTVCVKSYIRFFADILDIITLENGKKIWIEKTPQHLFYIKRIERYMKNTKFLHVVRNGEDVVASLYDVTHKYPEMWGGARTINQCVKRWENDLKITKKYVSQQNHIAVKYEELVDNPEKIIKLVCEFIGVEFHKMMLKKYRIQSNKILQKGENWKQEVQEKIANNNSKKFFCTFNHEEREYIKKSLQKCTSSAFYRKLQSGRFFVN